jgi:hypothetical protein
VTSAGCLYRTKPYTAKSAKTAAKYAKKIGSGVLPQR